MSRLNYISKDKIILFVRGKKIEGKSLTQVFYGYLKALIKREI